MDLFLNGFGLGECLPGEPSLQLPAEPRAMLHRLRCAGAPAVAAVHLVRARHYDHHYGKGTTLGFYPHRWYLGT